MRALILLVSAMAVAAPIAAQPMIPVPSQTAQGDIAVTIYNNNRALIEDKRQLDLPAGRSRQEFRDVSAQIEPATVTLNGRGIGIVEQNFDFDLLSPAALVDGYLGNRVTISRTNPATGLAKSENAIVRTRADGGLVLQTSEGFEAVRCAGLPEKLLFDRVPAGLSAEPVFSIDTDTPRGGSYRITLTYLAAGFDWRANYLATLEKGVNPGKQKLRLLAWLTIANDNGQTFPDATLLAVAGTINVVRNFRALSDPPEAKPLRLTCYPLGSTARGTVPAPPAPPQFYAPAPLEADKDIIVTGSRASGFLDARAGLVAMKASEETLGDVKLYRVPEHVTVASQSLKQVAFLDQPRVNGMLFHRGACRPGSDGRRAALRMTARRTVVCASVTSRRIFTITRCRCSRCPC